MQLQAAFWAEIMETSVRTFSQVFSEEAHITIVIKKSVFFFFEGRSGLPSRQFHLCSLSHGHISTLPTHTPHSSGTSLPLMGMAGARQDSPLHPVVQAIVVPIATQGRRYTLAILTHLNSNGLHFFMN